ncbi:unnamed protein product [Caenorhabditis angaria]|uniref:F-box domain-containing protein n=1 Tax=Caenorhabditis angaria TaxID=860376 RepID=A0A9P1I8C6_9PELO|nr:unnamed protein product [Caenorhabditis angaria]
MKNEVFKYLNQEERFELAKCSLGFLRDVFSQEKILERLSIEMAITYKGEQIGDKCEVEYRGHFFEEIVGDSVKIADEIFREIHARKNRIKNYVITARLVPSLFMQGEDSNNKSHNDESSSSQESLKIMTGWNDLPDRIKFQIFEYLNTEQRLKFAKCSHRCFEEVLRVEKNIERLELNTVGTLLVLSINRDFKVTFKQVGDVCEIQHRDEFISKKIGKSENIAYEIFESILLKSEKNIKHLDISGVIVDMSRDEVINKFPGLKALDVCRGTFDKVTGWNNLPKETKCKVFEYLNTEERLKFAKCSFRCFKEVFQETKNIKRVAIRSSTFRKYKTLDLTINRDCDITFKQIGNICEIEYFREFIEETFGNIENIAYEILENILVNSKDNLEDLNICSDFRQNQPDLRQFRRISTGFHRYVQQKLQEQTLPGSGLTTTTEVEKHANELRHVFGGIRLIFGEIGEEPPATLTLIIVVLQVGYMIQNRLIKKFPRVKTLIVSTNRIEQLYSFLSKAENVDTLFVDIDEPNSTENTEHIRFPDDFRWPFIERLRLKSCNVHVALDILYKMETSIVQRFRGITFTISDRNCIEVDRRMMRILIKANCLRTNLSFKTEQIAELGESDNDLELDAFKIDLSNFVNLALHSISYREFLRIRLKNVPIDILQFSDKLNFIPRNNSSRVRSNNNNNSDSHSKFNRRNNKSIFEIRPQVNNDSNSTLHGFYNSSTRILVFNSIYFSEYDIERGFKLEAEDFYDNVRDVGGDLPEIVLEESAEEF